MKRRTALLLLFTLMLTFFYPIVYADKVSAPWGYAKQDNIQYKPQKLLYDLSTGDPKELDNILDRVGTLYKLYGSDLFDSSIVIIIHGDAIPFFAIEHLVKNKMRMQRAYSLSFGSSIEFRMCQLAAKMMNYKANDIHGFVTMIPMADAEIVRLQQAEGYAYIQ